MLDWIEKITPPFATLISAVMVAIVSIWTAIKTRQSSKQLTQLQSKLQSEMQKSLDHFRDSLERQRAFSVFQRDSIASHLDNVVQSFVELYCVAEVVGLRSWLLSEDHLETERRFKSAYYKMEIHFNALKAFGVVPENIVKEWDWEMSQTKPKWDDVMGEAARRTPEFRLEHPNADEFSSKKFSKMWIELMAWLDKMIRLVTRIPAKISIPI